MKANYKVTYFSFDNKLKRIEDSTINLIMIKLTRSKIINGLKYFLNLRRILKSQHFDFVIIENLKLAFLVKLFVKKSIFILDIRSGSVFKSYLKRIIRNIYTRINIKLFNHITIISEGLAKYYKISCKKYTVISLGSDVMSDTKKDFSKLRLLYVGIFSNRKIEKTIEGFAKFIKKYQVTNYTYDIVGFGKYKDEEKIKQAIKKYNLDKYITIHGRLHHSEMSYLFDNCNVGISFVPTLKYYEYQPPTKTFEYILSGMVCIATNTYENKKVINHKNGILCEYSPDGICEALTEFWENRDKYNSNTIIESGLKYKWSEVLKELIRYINKISSKDR
jgi:hypothetical protein